MTWGRADASAQNRVDQRPHIARLSSQDSELTARLRRETEKRHAVFSLPAAVSEELRPVETGPHRCRRSQYLYL